MGRNLQILWIIWLYQIRLIENGIFKHFKQKFHQSIWYFSQKNFEGLLYWFIYQIKWIILKPNYFKNYREILKKMAVVTFFFLNIQILLVLTFYVKPYLKGHWMKRLNDSRQNPIGLSQQGFACFASPRFELCDHLSRKRSETKKKKAICIGQYINYIFRIITGNYVL